MRSIYGFLVLMTLSLIPRGAVLAAPPAERTLMARADARNVNDADSQISVPRDLSDREKIRFTEDAIGEMKEGLEILQRKIDDARKAKDLGLLNCLNEKYASVNALLKITETADALLREAIVSSNSADAEHQFRKVVIARFKARRSLAEAGTECVEGSEDPSSGSDGDVQILVDKPLDLDPKVNDVPISDSGDTELPPPASP